MDRNIVRQVVFNLSEIHNFSPSTVLAVIECESKFDPAAIGYNKRNGEVWSKDHGLMQINDFYHLQESKRMGYDIVNEPIDNLMYGIYLVKKNGLKDYEASRSCIDKKLSEHYLARK